MDTPKDKYDHTWHLEVAQITSKLKRGVASHGAPDYLEIKLFVGSSQAVSTSANRVQLI